MIQRRKVPGKIIERQVIGAQEIDRKKAFHELLLDLEPIAVSHAGLWKGLAQLCLQLDSTYRVPRWLGQLKEEFRAEHAPYAKGTLRTRINENSSAKGIRVGDNLDGSLAFSEATGQLARRYSPVSLRLEHRSDRKR